MQSCLMSVSTYANRKCTLDELSLDYQCDAVLALTEADAQTVSGMLYRVACGDDLTLEQRIMLGRLVDVFGSRHVADSHQYL